MEFDAAGISLTDGGDVWTVHPDGRLDRRYDRFEGFEAFLDQLAGRPKVDASRPVNREHVLEAAYDAFWSPSATNWQPTRVLEVVGDGLLLRVPAREVKVESRLGHGPRFVRFADGGRCEVADDAGLDEVIATWAPRRAVAWLHRVETSWSLVARTHRGDREAAGELLPRYCRAVFRYLVVVVRDEATAEELCQEFAFRFVRGDFRHARPDKGRFRDYVKRSVLNLAEEFRRKRQAAEKLITFDSRVLEAATVPCGPINRLDDVFEDPQVKARGLRVDVPHPSGGTAKLVASPMRLSATPTRCELAPPTLGQHTDEVLREVLDLDPARLQSLRSQGVI